VSNRTEIELVNAARTGDVDCFGELYRRHYAAVVGAAYCLLADRHLAEDAAQEAFAMHVANCAVCGERTSLPVGFDRSPEESPVEWLGRIQLRLIRKESGMLRHWPLGRMTAISFVTR
jgi:hypothetical protein